MGRVLRFRIRGDRASGVSWQVSGRVVASVAGLVALGAGLDRLAALVGG